MFPRLWHGCDPKSLDQIFKFGIKPGICFDASGRQEAFYSCEGPSSYRHEVFEDARGGWVGVMGFLWEASEGMFHSELSADDPRLRTINVQEFGGGDLSLPQRAGYKLDAPVYVYVATRIAMLHNNFKHTKLATLP